MFIHYFLFIIVVVVVVVLVALDVLAHVGVVVVVAYECLSPLANPLVAERAFRASDYWGLTRVSKVHGK